MKDQAINQNLIQNERLYKELQKLGLSKRESLVYVAALQLGTSSIQNVSTLSGVNRATTYVLIEGLVKKGLMHSVTYGKKRFFTAEEPNKLDFFINDDKLELERKSELVKNLIPELDKIFDINKLENKTKVKFYDSTRGAEIISSDILKTKDSNELYMLYNYDLITPEFNFDFGVDLIKKRIKRGIKTFGGFVSKDGKSVLAESKKLVKNSKSSIIFLDDQNLLKNYKIFLASIGNKSIIVSLEGDFVGIIIKSKPVALAVQKLITMVTDVTSSSK